MDPASAFTLACGIIQVVDFSTKILSAAKEYLHKGYTAQNDELESQMSSIDSLLSALNAERSSQSPSPDRDDIELLELAK